MKAKSFQYPFSFLLESGSLLPGLQLQYYTAGTLNAHRNNVIWICHSMLHDGQFDRWWPQMAGPGKLLDTNQYFIICVDMPGGAGKSSGPFSNNPATGSQYLHNFPGLTIKDINTAFDLLREDLQISRIYSLIGIGLGAQVALSWNSEHCDLSENLVLFGGGGKVSYWIKEQYEIQEQILALDPTWQLQSSKAGENSQPVIKKFIENSSFGVFSQIKESMTRQLWGKYNYLSINPFSLRILQPASAAYESDEMKLKKIKSSVIFILSTNDPVPDYEALLDLLKKINNAECHFLPSEFGSMAYFHNLDFIVRELQPVFQQKYKRRLA